VDDGGGRMTGERAFARSSSSFSSSASFSMASSPSSSSLSVSTSFAACTSAFFPGPLSDFVMCECGWDFACEAFRALPSMLATSTQNMTKRMVAFHILKQESQQQTKKKLTN